MNMHDLVVTVWLTTLCIDGYLAPIVPPVPTPAQKGQNLTFTCSGCSSCTCSWTTYTYQNGTLGPLNRVGTSACTNTVRNISETNLNQVYECSSSQWLIVPINAIYSEPAINAQGNGSYTCSANGTGFGQLVLNWTVNGMPVTSGATITYTNQTNGGTVSAMSTLRVTSAAIWGVLCTAYFDTNRTNSSTSKFVQGVTTSIVTPSPSVLPTSSSDSSTTPSVPPHTSTPPLSTIPPTSSVALNSSSLPDTNGNTTGIADPATVTISLATVLSGVVILGCIIIILVLVLKHHRNSKSWCSNKWWGKEEEMPANLFCSCNPPLMRQIAIPVDTALTPPPQSSVPSLPAQEVESKSDYDFVSFTPKVTPTKVGEEEVYHHLKRPVPKLSAPVEIYSQLHLSHRSSHTSLHSTSSSSSHHPCAPQHLGGQCPSCHGSQPLCSCCNESSHHCSGHLCTTCPGRSGHVCHRSDSLTNCEDEQTPMSTSLPVGHTQPSPTLSPLRATRPSYLPLNNSNVLPSSHNATMPLHMKTPTSHLVPVPPPKKRSMSLTTIAEMPTPMTTPAGQRTEQRTSTPMPPLHTKLQQAAFSTHDIPAIVLSSGSPMTVVTNPMSIPAMCSLPSHHTTVSHNSRADTRTLKSTRENEVPSNAEPTPLKASSNLKPNLNSSLLSVQGRRSHKEDWVLPKLNHGSITSLNCREDRHCYSHSLPYYSSNSSHLQGIDARSDPGYETDRDTLNYKLVTIRKTTSLRLPDPASAKNETLV